MTSQSELIEKIFSEKLLEMENIVFVSPFGLPFQDLTRWENEFNNRILSKVDLTFLTNLLFVEEAKTLDCFLTETQSNFLKELCSIYKFTSNLRFKLTDLQVILDVATERQVSSLVNSILKLNIHCPYGCCKRFTILRRQKVDWTYDNKEIFLYDLDPLFYFLNHCNSHKDSEGSLAWKTNGKLRNDIRKKFLSAHSKPKELKVDWDKALQKMVEEKKQQGDNGQRHQLKDLNLAKPPEQSNVGPIRFTKSSKKRQIENKDDYSY